MHFRHIVAYTIRGTHPSPERPEIELVNDPASRLVVTFTKQPHERLFESDRRVAVANMMLEGMLRKSNDRDLDAAIANYVEYRREEYENRNALFPRGNDY